MSKVVARLDRVIFPPLGQAKSPRNCVVAQLRLFEIALVLMRLDDVASLVVNANHNIM